MFTDLTAHLTTSQHWANVNQHVTTTTNALLLTGSQAMLEKPVGFLHQSSSEKLRILELSRIMCFIVFVHVSLINTIHYTLAYGSSHDRQIHCIVAILSILYCYITIWITRLWLVQRASRDVQKYTMLPGCIMLPGKNDVSYVSQCICVDFLVRPLYYADQYIFYTAVLNHDDEKVTTLFWFHRAKQLR